MITWITRASSPTRSRLLNDFAPPAAGWTPSEFAFAGGAPGLSAILHVDPARRQTVVLLANLTPVRGSALARRVQELLQ